MQKMVPDPIGISSLPICILRPQGEAKVISNAVGALEDSLRTHDIEVVVCTWPPDIEDVRDKFVIALLDMERPFLCDLDAVDFDILRQVALQSARLLWVCPSDDPHMAVATGWLRVLQNENVNKHYQYLALERRADGSAPDCALAIAKVAMAQTEEREFIERSGLLNIPRWSYDPEMTRTVTDSVVSLERDTTLLGDIASGLPLRMLHAGDPEHAHFTSDALRMPDLAADQVEIELRFVVIVDHDVKDPGTATLHEASGIIKTVGSDVSHFRPGDDVCLSFFGHLSTRVVAKESICQRVPAGVKMSEAACLPVTFATAVRALIDVARVKPRQNVLVQAGGTKIGRAVVLLATASDAIVYATARDAEEVKTLTELGVPRLNILSDDDLDIPAATKVLTDSKGWDVIVRTDKPASATCLLPGCIAPNGAVVDVYPSGLDRMRETTISLMGVGSLLPEDPVLMQKTVSHAVAYLGQLSTFVGSFDIFPSSAVTDALSRQRSQGANRGVMLSFHHEDKIQVSPGVKNTMQLHDEATYILAGGLGGIGRGIAKLLVDNGARNLVFLSRAGPESPAATSLTKSMAGLGVTVKTFACDISDEQSLTRALNECTRAMPPIRGVIQAATVIRDAIFDNLTFENWQTNLRPKVGSWNLHEQLPRDMDFFVMLSSIAGLIGHRSQAGYAAGNTFQDSLALHRQSQGLPAVAIDLGAMLDVGTIMEGTTTANFSASEATWMTEAELHSIIKMCISGGIDEYATPPQVCTGIPSGGMVQLGHHKMPLHFKRPFFVALKHLGTTGVATSEPTAMVDKMTELLHQLAASNSLADAEICAEETLCAHLAELLQRAADSIDLEEGLHKYGIDSLMAVELRTWIGKMMKADVSLFDVLNAKSIRELSSKIAKASKLVSRDVQ
jgi:NADPH:quinone reductase-like Zn-dependent oxidoreductase/NADP-dependent 3-hydroxy acid dehydrogenase YdfG/acyl carrier protein